MPDEDIAHTSEGIPVGSSHEEERLRDLNKRKEPTIDPKQAEMAPDSVPGQEEMERAERGGDPVTRPRDASLASEGLPPRAEEGSAQAGAPERGEAERDPKKPDRPAQAVRQDAGLGDTSARDETRR